MSISQMLLGCRLPLLRYLIDNGLLTPVVLHVLSCRRDPEKQITRESQLDILLLLAFDISFLTAISNVMCCFNGDQNAAETYIHGIL